MWRLVLMSGKWYSTKVRDFEAEAEDSLEFINAGDIIAFTDDVEYFADELGIELDEIVQAD
jgi:hypothetical protein